MQPDDSKDIPQVHELDVHFEKLETVVGHIITATLERVRRIQEKCSTLITNVTARGEATRGEVAIFKELCRDTVDSAKIMEGAVDELAAKLQVQLPPAAKSTKPPDKPSLVDKAAAVDKAIEERRKLYPPRIETVTTGHFSPERPLGKTNG
jgi:hypothetical protein